MHVEKLEGLKVYLGFHDTLSIDVHCARVDGQFAANCKPPGRFMLQMAGL